MIVLIDYFLTPLHSENRYQYLELMEDFIDGSISGEQCTIKFFKMCRSIARVSNMLEEDFERLINFQPNSKAYGFSGIVANNTFMECEMFNPDLDRDDSELDEEELRDFVQETIT